jgi:predicted nucleic acid-binding protein
MGTLIDTSVLVAAQRDQIDVSRMAASQPAEPVAIPAICAAELRHGPYRLPHAVARSRAEQRVEQLITSFPVIAFDLDMARVHARLAAELAEKGTQVGAHDLLIAATAVWLDYRVATRDLRSFPKIRGLDVVRW